MIGDCIAYFFTAPLPSSELSHLGLAGYARLAFNEIETIADRPSARPILKAQSSIATARSHRLPRCSRSTTQQSHGMRRSIDAALRSLPVSQPTTRRKYQRIGGW